MNALQTNGFVVFAPDELHIHAARQLREQLRAQRRADFIIDLSGATDAHLAAVSLLNTACRQVRLAGGSVQVVAPSEAVRGVLHLANTIRDVDQIRTSLESALDARSDTTVVDRG